MGLGYPGGPIIDKLARQGNPKAYTFSKPHIPGLDYSFSGLKTSFLYLLRDKEKENPDFVSQNLPDLCASIQATVVEILIPTLLLFTDAGENTRSRCSRHLVRIPSRLYDGITIFRVTSRVLFDCVI
jgi:tRNA A37 threonylcarbamoyltransferase TsaD